MSSPSDIAVRRRSGFVVLVVLDSALRTFVLPRGVVVRA